MQGQDSYVRRNVKMYKRTAPLVICGSYHFPCCDDPADAYSRGSWFDAAYLDKSSGSCSCIIPKGSDLGIAGGESSAIDICAA